jgi:hypothetical protein
MTLEEVMKNFTFLNDEEKKLIEEVSVPEHLDTTAGRMWTADKLRIFVPAL